DLLPREPLGVPTHPYPLYEIASVMVLLLGLWLFRDRLASQSRTFLVAMIGYAAIRFGLTFFRQETVLFWGLQEAQVISLVTGVAALGTLLWNRRRAKELVAAT
ncbi:MAG: prolipoprotein diacylglyceryl transferase, partial [Dehalococcoidia bacterium]|nr:prolipoprotein diacylglyceryl transferase [Dehalococcoidia bacterium]